MHSQTDTDTGKTQHRQRHRHRKTHTCVHAHLRAHAPNGAARCSTAGRQSTSLPAISNLTTAWWSSTRSAMRASANVTNPKPRDVPFASRTTLASVLELRRRRGGGVQLEGWGHGMVGARDR